MTSDKTIEFGGDRGHSATSRNTTAAVLNGARLRCPACGHGRLFHAYLKVAERCPSCGEELFHHRADDAPAYFTITVVGHIVVGGALVLEKMAQPESWVHLSIWLPLVVLLSLTLLPVFKGALVGLQWALGMHGFDKTVRDPALPEPIPAIPSTADIARPTGR